MSLGLPQPVFTQPGMPSRSIGTLPTTDPSGNPLLNAHGRVKEAACVSVEVSGACTLTLFVFSPGSNSWINPSSSTASYQKTFTGAGMDYFVAPPGAFFYLKSSAGSITCYTDGATV